LACGWRNGFQTKQKALFRKEKELLKGCLGLCRPALPTVPQPQASEENISANAGDGDRPGGQDFRLIVSEDPKADNSDNRQNDADNHNHFRFLHVFEILK